MSKGNMLLGYARGKVGDLVLTRVGGQQVQRAYNATPRNPKTKAQTVQRTKLANLINLYRRGKNLLDHSFTNRKENQSSYNAFISRNINMVPVHLTRSQAAAAMSVVGPMVVSDGVIPPITITGGGVDAVTNISVPGLVIDENTTIAMVSRIIIANNPDWQEGDQLTYVSVVQNGGVNGGYPFAQFSYFEMDINPSDGTLLRDIMPDYAFSVVNGFVAHGAKFADGGYCWIHSRKSASGALQASRQELILTSNTLFEQYSSESQLSEATRSYNAQGNDLLVPDGSAAGADTTGIPVIASLKVNNMLMSNSSSGFPTALMAGTPVSVELSGSNLEVAAGDLNVEEILSITWKPTTGADILIEPQGEYESSSSSFSAMFAAASKISDGAAGKLIVQFNNNMGGIVEQEYTFTTSSSGTGSNPL